MQHDTFVVTPARFHEIEARLKACGIDYLGPIPQLRRLLGIHFYDPNSIRLEYDCQPEDGEEPAVIACVAQTRDAARAELASLPDVTPEWIDQRLAAMSWR